MDDGKKSEMQHQLGVDGNPVVVFLGSFRPWHGTGMLPDLIDATRRDIPDIRFLLVGDGEGLDTLRADIKDRGLDTWVRFVGSVPHHKMPDVLSCADIGIAPYDANRYQPLIDHGFFWSPAKLFEYAACGLPVVCSRYDLLSDIVEDGVTGRLVAPGDSQAFADAVIDLSRDSQRRHQMGSRGREKVTERFSWDIHARQVAGILEQLVADGCDRERG
jgi:glycosyltransferase involved in cell wall biosynthesis